MTNKDIKRIPLLDIIEQLEEFRAINRLRQDQIADMLRLSRETINSWVTGRRKPTKKHCYLIKHLLEDPPA